MQGRVHLGGALSGRDIEAVNKTVSGLTKLLFPDPEMPISDQDLEWIVRVALESRRRVKEQQKRVFNSEFRHTHFSYILGPEGIEQFVATPERVTGSSATDTFHSCHTQMGLTNHHLCRIQMGSRRSQVSLFGEPLRV